jgi:hypothetical protein
MLPEKTLKLFNCVKGVEEVGFLAFDSRLEFKHLLKLGSGITQLLGIHCLKYHHNLPQRLIWIRETLHRDVVLLLCT